MCSMLGPGRRVVRDSSSASIAAGWLAFPPGDNSLVTVSLDGVFRTWVREEASSYDSKPPMIPPFNLRLTASDLMLSASDGHLDRPGPA